MVRSATDLPSGFAPTDRSAATVVVCAFSDERREGTVRCVLSALSQHPRPAEVIVVVDHNAQLAADLRQRLPTEVRITPNAGTPGLSAARNTAIELASGDWIAFLDDDAVAAPGWLAALGSALDDPEVAGVGGRAIAAWDLGRPPWFPEEFLWVVGCSYRGQPEAGEVRNPLGCNMAFRREVFDRVGGFDTQMGRMGKLPLGCEETELCLRARRQEPAWRFVLVSGADVQHRVPAPRGEPRYLLRRCFYEGMSKALVRTLGDTQSLHTERAYVSRVLTLALMRAVRRVGLGPERGSGVGQIAAILAGLNAAAGGYLAGRLAFREERPAA